MLKPKVYRLCTSNLVGGLCMRYQLPQPAIKACEVGLLHADWGIPCWPHPAAIQLVGLNYVLVFQNQNVNV